jgi:hypothetical protein
LLDIKRICRRQETPITLSFGSLRQYLHALTVHGKAFMGAPINTPSAGEIWHLSIEDLFAPVQETHRLGGSGPFVINLSVSTAPIFVPTKSFAGWQSAFVYLIQVTEDSRPRYRLRLGPFETEDDAEAILDEVRDIYPGALTASAGAADMRSIESMQAKRDASQAAARKLAEKKSLEIAMEKAAEIVIDIAPPAPTVPAVLAQPEAPQARQAAIEPPVAEIPIDLSPDWALPVLNQKAAVPVAPSKTPAPSPILAAPAPVLTEVAAKVPDSPKPRLVTQSVNAFPGLESIPIYEQSGAAGFAPVLTEAVERVQSLPPEIKTSAMPSAPAEKPQVAESVAPVAQTSTELRESLDDDASSDTSMALESLALELEAAVIAAAPPVPPPPSPKAAQPPMTAAASAPPPRPARFSKFLKRLETAPAHRMSTATNRSPFLRKPTAQPKAAPEVVAAPAPAPAAIQKTVVEPMKISSAAAAQPAQVFAEKSAPRQVKQLAQPLSNLESTQTVRALTAPELESREGSRWFVIQLSVSEKAFDPDLVPNLDIFSEYRLYSVAGVDQGHATHTLRLGFFTEEFAALAVASYLGAYYDQPTVRRVSVAERQRFNDQRVEARKDVGESGKHAVIEITNELVARKRRGTDEASPAEISKPR